MTVANVSSITMIWGMLWILCEADIIDWDNARRLYGEFMSKVMGLR